MELGRIKPSILKWKTLFILMYRRMDEENWGKYTFRTSEDEYFIEQF